MTDQTDDQTRRAQTYGCCQVCGTPRDVQRPTTASGGVEVLMVCPNPDCASESGWVDGPPLPFIDEYSGISGLDSAGWSGDGPAGG